MSPPRPLPTATGANPKAKPRAQTLVGTGPPPPDVSGDMIVADKKTEAKPSTPPPIVPRRRTPVSGTVPPTPEAIATAKTIIGGSAPPPPGPAPFVPKITPIGTPAPDLGTDLAPPVGDVEVKVKAKDPSDPPMRGKTPSVAPGDIVPPVIRIPQGGMLGSSTEGKRKTDTTLLCEILLRNGSVTQENVDKALALQEDKGGQIGRILVSIGACEEQAIARALVEQLRLRKKTGYITDISAAARENKDVAGLKVLTRPGRTVLTLLATDIFSLLLAAMLATAVHWIRLGQLDWTSWLVVGPSIALCILTFLGLELYSPMAKSTPDEIRDIVFAASLVHLMASLLSTLGDLPIVAWGVMVRGIWWTATLFLVPVIRSLVRGKLSTQPWWGIPVCVLGAAKTGRLVVRTLKAQPRSGLKPVMMLDDDPTKHGTLRASFTNEKMDVYSVNVSASQFMSETQRHKLAADLFGDAPSDDAEIAGPISSDHIPVAPVSFRGKADSAADVDSGIPLGPDSAKPKRVPKESSAWPRGKFAEVDGVPLVGDLSLAPVLAHRLHIPYAVLAMPGVDSAKLLQIVERVGGKFSHILVIPDLFGFATLGVPAKNLGGILGVEVRQQLLLPGPRLAKRIIDIALTGVGIFFVLPFLLLIALLIKIDSKGPVFYTQKRLGKDGEHFKAYKFRTMHGDGEARLKAILDADPALKAEYEIYHKLRKDPRITRIGRILRKFSLDEFPQLLNVILGDMSLVGPRPYIERELTEMSGQEKIILRAPPGMTGMWQVSDRNATSFAQRCQIDVYYVRNWSPWLDIHILAKTFGVVIKGSGV
jgi:lipopolysaccharide/colanic/teichoic acid biosynthesis glycosyltransferase